ncbi:MAG: hypothetical protein U1E26_11125 [Coriobacteriia bacterium]|nr:hypothetical protein [Coriobacteriia bacterium]
MSHHGTSRAVALILVALFAALVMPVGAHAITRAEVLARGERWISTKTPYSQSRYARLDGRLIATSTTNPARYGYRTDCSGFVSMTLGLTDRSGRPLSLSTAALDDVMRPITKRELLPGDIILRPKDLKIGGKPVAYGHAVVFAGWVDEKQTRYVAYHQSSSGRGAVRAQVDWGVSGFWKERGFAPYRCMLVNERVKISGSSGK